MKSSQNAVMLLVIVGAACFSLRGSRATDRPAQAGDDRFQTAQRDIGSAIGNLQAFLVATPQANESALARIQLAALQNLQIRDVPPTPVSLATYLQKVQWYVDKVERTPTATRVTLKVLGLSADQDCQFVGFSAVPLAIIGDDREIYAMTKPPALPKGVQISHYNIAGGSTNTDYWVFQGGRTLTIEAEFDRMPDGVAGGQVQYTKPVAGAVAARFSLTNARQRP